MKAYFFALGIFAVFLIAGCTAAPEATTSPQVPAVTRDSGVAETSDAASPQPESTAQSAIREIEVTARQWDFTPDTITVKQGDTVRLNVNSIDVTHGFAIPEFGVNERLSPGQTVEIEFVADKTGTFTFFCSVQCGAGHSDMRGTLVVE